MRPFGRCEARTSAPARGRPPARNSLAMNDPRPTVAKAPSLSPSSIGKPRRASRLRVPGASPGCAPPPRARAIGSPLPSEAFHGFLRRSDATFYAISQLAPRKTKLRPPALGVENGRLHNRAFDRTHATRVELGALHFVTILTGASTDFRAKSKLGAFHHLGWPPIHLNLRLQVGGASRRAESRTRRRLCLASILYADVNPHAPPKRRSNAAAARLIFDSARNEVSDRASKIAPRCGRGTTKRRVSVNQASAI